MRRLLFYVFTGGFLLGMLSGCTNLGLRCHSQGICDCDMDDDPCAHRAPWVRQSTYPALYTNRTMSVPGATSVAPVAATPVPGN